MVVLDQRKATQSNARDIKVHALIHLAPGSSANKRLLNSTTGSFTSGSEWGEVIYSDIGSFSLM